MRWVQWALALALIPSLALADHWLSEGRTTGFERNAIQGALARIDEKPDASGVILLGSSTSRDWIRIARLPRQFGEDKADVLAAQVNGCQQGCTWAEVRRLLSEGRHFRVALFGTNQYQMCEHEHSKRVLQHRSLAPAGDAGAFLSAYLHTERPLRWIGRYLFGAVSGAYADTAAVQHRLGREWMGRDRIREELFYIRPDAPPEPLELCAYSARDVAYKRELSRRLFADLAQLADRVFILILPDRSLADADDPAIARAWDAHRQLHEELAAAHDNVVVLDLTAGEVYAHEDFKDGVHLVRDRYARQRDALARELERVGYDPSAHAEAER